MPNDQSHRDPQQRRYAIALLDRVTQGQADAAAGRTLPHAQVMADAYALIDAVAALEKRWPTGERRPGS